MPDLDGLEAAAEANRLRPIPVVVISGHHEAALLERAAVDYVMTYLVKPVKPTDLQAAVTLAVSRFANLQQARGEAAELRQALEERKMVERAKGAVTRRVGVAGGRRVPADAQGGQRPQPEDGRRGQADPGRRGDVPVPWRRSRAGRIARALRRAGGEFGDGRPGSALAGVDVAGRQGVGHPLRAAATTS